jgi:hypothetical protein
MPTKRRAKAQAKPRSTIQVNLRLDPSLRLRLEREAARHQTNFNNELRVRLEQSLEVAQPTRLLSDIASDIEINWHRFGDRFLELQLGEDILVALEDRNCDKAIALATVLRKTQALGAQRRAEKMAATPATGEQQ